MLHPSQKAKDRKAKFQRLGAALSILGKDYAWRDWLGDYEYSLRPTPVDDPELTSRLGGPAMPTLQFAATVRVDDAD